MRTRLTPCVGAQQVNPWGAMAAPAELAAYRERLWAALSTDSASGLESGLLEVVVAEANAGRAAGFRRVLLQALDVSSVAQSARIGDLVQRYAEFAKLGSADAAVLLGAMLCFHATGNSQALPSRQQHSQHCLAQSDCSKAISSNSLRTLIHCACQKRLWGPLTAARRAQDLARQGFSYLERDFTARSYFINSLRTLFMRLPEKAASSRLRGARRTWRARASATWPLAAPAKKRDCRVY